jgi:hypothetical protein
MAAPAIVHSVLVITSLHPQSEKAGRRLPLGAETAGRRARSEETAQSTCSFSGRIDRQR